MLYYVLFCVVCVDVIGGEGGVMVDKGGDVYDVRRRRIFVRVGCFLNVVCCDWGGMSFNEMVGSVWVVKV